MIDEATLPLLLITYFIKSTQNPLSNCFLHRYLYRCTMITMEPKDT